MNLFNILHVVTMIVGVLMIAYLATTIMHIILILAIIGVILYIINNNGPNYGATI